MRRYGLLGLLTSISLAACSGSESFGSASGGGSSSKAGSGGMSAASSGAGGALAGSPGSGGTAANAGTSPTDPNCGDAPLGSTCVNADHTCAALSCISGTWDCKDGQTRSPLIPGVCGTAGTGGDSGLAGAAGASSEGGADNGGACDLAPVGTTCRNPDGTCDGLICTAGQWGCAPDQERVPVVPGSCN